MRTADEIINDYLKGGERFSLWLKPSIIQIINDARKEAIEECAERAKSEWIRYGTNMGHAVEKQSILSLIKELK